MSPGTLRGAIREVTRRRTPFTGPAHVVGIARRGASYRTVTLSAPCLEGRTDVLPADAIKLSLPGTDGTPPPVAAYTAAGVRWPEGAVPPVTRTLTIGDFDPSTGRLTLDVFAHEHGALADWLATVAPGQHVAVSGVRCEFSLNTTVTRWLIVADPASLPAAAILAALPEDSRTTAVIETPTTADRPLIPARTGVEVHWATSDGLAAAVSALPNPNISGAWVAGERTVVKTIRAEITRRFAVPAENLHAVAYWFAGQSMTATDSAKTDRYTRAIQAGLDPTEPGLMDTIEMLDNPPDDPSESHGGGHAG